VIWLTNLRLHAIQRRYYRGDESAIPEYFAELAAARKSLNLPRKKALHLGSGAYHIDGWVNVDLTIADHPDVVADLTATLPFRDGSFDYIHSEDFIEHIDFVQGQAFLRECARVLRPSGVLRLLTPDLAALIRRVYLGREARHLKWCSDVFAAKTPAEALNVHLRMNGEHRFIYDAELLEEQLHSAGFRTRQVRYNRSTDPFLRFLDLRDFGLNLFLEAVKTTHQP
jgi:predicted SAM-dependent methyltransferase